MLLKLCLCYLCYCNINNKQGSFGPGQFGYPLHTQRSFALFGLMGSPPQESSNSFGTQHYPRDGKIKENPKINSISYSAFIVWSSAKISKRGIVFSMGVIYSRLSRLAIRALMKAYATDAIKLV